MYLLESCVIDWRVVPAFTFSNYFSDNEGSSSSGLRRSGKPPVSFVIVRLTSKSPCAVIWLAFPGGTCGQLRHRAFRALSNYLLSLKIKQKEDQRTFSSSNNTKEQSSQAAVEWTEHQVWYKECLKRFFGRFSQN